MNQEATRAIEALVKEERNRRIDECIERLEKAKGEPLRTVSYRGGALHKRPIETLVSDVELYMKRLGEIPDLIKEGATTRALEVALGARIDWDDMA